MAIEQQQPQPASATWLTKLSSKDASFMQQCMNTTELAQYINDMKKFSKAISKLCSNPYVLEEHGENPLHYLAVRDSIARTIDPAEDRSCAASRYAFAAWAFWQLPAHKSKMYTRVALIVPYCLQMDLDIDLFFEHLRMPESKVPSVAEQAKSYRICSFLQDKERLILQFLQFAVSFRAQHVAEPDALDPHQNHTIQRMLDAPFSMLHGGAGVGKTTTVGYLIKTLLKNFCCGEELQINCIAFTHKAKRCLQEKLDAVIPAANVRVSTIHSFIATLRSTRNRRNEGNEDDSQDPQKRFVLIDEASMLDIELLSSLAEVLMASGVCYQLAFVGDAMQLPPILRGEFFRHMIETNPQNAAFSNTLSKCYRADHSDLFDAYQAIRIGRLPGTSAHFQTIIVQTDALINRHVGRLIARHLPTVQTSTQFVAWQNKDVFKINQWIQTSLLGAGCIGHAHYMNFHENDKVMYRGDSTATLTNALVGRVKKVHSNGITVAWENGQELRLNATVLKSVVLAYALTVHSLQGSECERIVVACYDVAKMLHCQDRRILYTAVTRGKKEAVLIATPNIEEFLQSPIRPLPPSSIHF